MSETSPPDLSLFLDIVFKLEAFDIPYVIIGGFAGILYGLARATYDIDIIVDLSAEQIQYLCDAYPLPRYYADPEQMRKALKQGQPFNIIDTSKGEKADLFPVIMDEQYRPALEFRQRQPLEWPGLPPINVWIARREEVIYGKLMALAELYTERHVSDIYELLLLAFLSADLEGVEAITIDEPLLDARAAAISPEVATLWQSIKTSARDAASQM